MARAAVSTERKNEVEDNVGAAGDPWKTLLFNCSCHTFDQVENILIKSTHCSLARAREISWEIHSKGSDVVYVGHRERCEAVAEALSSIGLRVKVAQ